MTLELNQVLIEDEAQTFSLMASTGQMVGMTGGTAERRTRWLLTILGFQPIRQGYVSIDGEPLTDDNTATFRQLIGYSPKRLEEAGNVRKFQPPSVQHVFLLKANREQRISNGILGAEMRRISTTDDYNNIRLLAVAVLLNRPILLVDSPIPDAAAYLRTQARKGKVVVVATDNQTILSACDNIVELS